MISISQSISSNSRELLQFLKSTSFSKAILIAIAVTLPILGGILSGHLEIGLALCLGAFWSSPSDVSGSYRHKKFGILFSAVLVMVVSFIGGYLKFEAWLLLPILGILTFAIAFISVYGFRASLISFSGLLALVLSFAHDSQELEIYEYAFLVGVGGLWYLSLAVLWYRINPKAQTEELFGETFVLTAEFLETRGNLVGPQTDRKELQTKLYEIQSKLIEHHETLREILLLSRRTSGRSNYQAKRLLVFVQLVDMLETAIANPVNYDKMDALFNHHPEYIKSFQNLIFEMSRQLRVMAEVGTDQSKFPNNSKLADCFTKVKQEIDFFRKEREASDYEGFLMLQNLLEYQEKQFEKLKKIKWLLGNPDMGSVDLVDRNASKRFIVSQDYDPKLLLRNFSFKSTIFKHSLRLAVTVMIGYALGSYFDFQNPYWILLTIIVIMRPSYGLTKSRSKDRIIGTLIGGAIATGFVFLTQNPYVFGVLGVVSLVIAFSMVQRNYRAGATFITLSVVFIYAIMRPDVLTVIQYRVLDTLIGAGLSLVAMLWIWPAWGFMEIRHQLENSVKANREFLSQIANYYERKGKVTTTYKVSRKEAFVETSNLSSAFQRMAQEPVSKQKYLDKIYELVVLNHTFLSSLASFSTYIQNNPTTEASVKFKNFISKIDQNLGQVLLALKDSESYEAPTELQLEEFSKEQLPTFLPQNIGLSPMLDIQLDRDLQEAHLVTEQLQWLFSLSGKMLKLISKIEFD
ncbi:FUSC family protein [Arenibacter sp. BSSL-BM3]|uniref:FUSC family protein n=1 Tax=Arenibacter arenosicollis TaxID=2762274 RepID=A0ABR7QS64_9FLAO|nr:FUSC family membrane protein [Arenibacter arenosicollis]MBC8770034.1 FUSC family protein [Arenibacter arenosicollis]